MYMHQEKWRFLSYCWRNVAKDHVLYTVQGLWPDFGATLKIHKKSNFDRNQLKLSTQHKNMYMNQKKIIKMKISLLVIFGEIWSRTMYYSTGLLARFWSNFKNL